MSGNQQSGFRDTPEGRHLEIIVRGPIGAGKTVVSQFLADLFADGLGLKTTCEQHDRGKVRVVPPDYCAALARDVLDGKIKLDVNVTVIDEHV